MFVLNLRHAVDLCIYSSGFRETTLRSPFFPSKRTTVLVGYVKCVLQRGSGYARSRLISRTPHSQKTVVVAEPELSQVGADRLGILSARQ